MPEWSERPDETLRDSLSEILKELNNEIADGPTFEQVAGVPLPQLTEHAAAAVTGFIQHDRTNLQDPNAWVQVYCLGFLVGTKFGAKRAPDTSHEREHP